MVLVVSLRIAPILYFQPPLTSFFFVKAKPSPLVNHLATFSSLQRFPPMVFNIGIGFNSYIRDVAGCKGSVMAIDDSCASVI
ncbi:hypothetical protein TNCV_3166881 [Trichonephila clavipes]|uniref:Uncharacterized protein n=1 Tax=Trichonephila clavipes TaxID=2585209 RepID=A0A8X6V0L5_TRICX|nr:hypothetical protein TNCV_3166881 [Trichonephila clavipes]